MVIAVHVDQLILVRTLFLLMFSVRKSYLRLYFRRVTFRLTFTSMNKF